MEWRWDDKGYRKEDGKEDEECGMNVEKKVEKNGERMRRITMGMDKR